MVTGVLIEFRGYDTTPERDPRASLQGGRHCDGIVQASYAAAPAESCRQSWLAHPRLALGELTDDESRGSDGGRAGDDRQVTGRTSRSTATHAYLEASMLPRSRTRLHGRARRQGFDQLGEIYPRESMTASSMKPSSPGSSAGSRKAAIHGPRLSRPGSTDADTLLFMTPRQTIADSRARGPQTFSPQS